MIDNLNVYNNITALREIWENLPIINSIFEIILNILGAFPLALSIYLFSKIKIFHFNLTVLLIDLTTAYLIRTFIRTFGCCLITVEILCDYSTQFHDVRNYLDFICATCQFVCGMNLWLIFMERFYATLYAKIYEHSNNTFILAICVFVKWVFVFFLLFITAQGYISIIISVALCGILLLISGIGMVYLLHFNHKLYRRQSDKMRTLSYCYQLSENVRSFEMLIPMMTLLLIGCVFTMFIYISTMFLYDVYWKALLGAAFNLIVSGGSIFLPLFTMFFHRNLRNGVRRALAKRKTKTVSVSPISGVSSTFSKSVPRTLTGQKLIVENTDEATKVYFEQFSSQWN